jgi:response regulator of citrate/malate metabolism
MPKEKPILKTIERDIIKLIDRSINPLTTNEIAEKLGISYVTAKKYLKELVKKKILEDIDG